MEKIITEQDIEALREKVRSYHTPKRYAHALAVEKECGRLGQLLLPNCVMKLRASGLLHDITKKDDTEKQLQYCGEFGIIVCNSDIRSPKLLHAKTAAAMVARDFPEFCDDDIVSGIRYHTTGRDGMTTFEAIVYLADYIEETRSFPDCIRLRDYFWNGIYSNADAVGHFRRTIVKSFDMTMKCLISEGSPIDRDTVEARNYFIALIAEKT